MFYVIPVDFLWRGTVNFIFMFMPVFVPMLMGTGLEVGRIVRWVVWRRPVHVFVRVVL